MTSPAGRQRVFFLVHVPKCGGSTLKGIMRRNFRDGYMEEYRLLEPRELRYREDDLNRLIDFVPGLRLFSGHCISAELPYGRADVEVVGITAIRDPLERIVSWYFYNRNTHPYAHVEKRQNLEAYLDYALSEYDFESDPWRWSQVADLVNVSGTEGLNRITRLVEERRLYVFPLPRFDETLCLLERMWPEDFRDCSYPWRENESRYDQVFTDAISKKLDRLGARVEIQDDRRLLELADRELTRLISAHAGSPDRFTELLREFRARCNRVRNVEKWVRAPLRRVRRIVT